MRIVDLRPRDRAHVRQVARLLVDGFREHEPDAFPDMRAAALRKSFDPERLSRVAVERSGAALGWIGGIRHYRGRTWELHLLVVRPDRQRQGIGRALVRDFERQVARRGATTIYLGTDDIDGRTSVGGSSSTPMCSATRDGSETSAATPTASIRSSASPWSASCRTPTGLAAPTSSWPSA